MEIGRLTSLPETTQHIHSRAWTEPKFSNSSLLHSPPERTLHLSTKPEHRSQELHENAKRD